METVIIKSAIKTSRTTKENKPVIDVVLEDGRKCTAFDEKVIELIGKETSAELKEGKEYQGAKPLYINLPKEKKGFTKDYGFEKKRVALECATRLASAGRIEVNQIAEFSENFLKFLNA